MTTAESKQVQRVYLIISAVVVIAVVVFALFLVIPYTFSESSYCKYCRAYRTETRVLWVRTDCKITQNAVSKYWIAHIDAGHKHSWKFMSRSYRTIGGGGIGCGGMGSVRRMLREETEVAILRSFNTPSERTAFVERFLAWDAAGPMERRTAAIEQLEYAYEQNPARKDWQKILKQLGVIK